MGACSQILMAAGHSQSGLIEPSRESGEGDPPRRTPNGVRECRLSTYSVEKRHRGAIVF